MTAPQPDSPEDILREMQGYIDDDEIQEKVRKEALAKLQKYYTNKFLEIIGADEKARQPLQTCRNLFRAKLRQAIKKLKGKG